MIELRDLRFAYDGKAPLFDGFHWRVQSGEAWAVIGPSGCGKTTLLYLLAGLRRPLGGTVLVGGKPVHRPRRSTGLILQDYGLLPWATAWENVVLGLRIRGVPQGRQVELAGQWLHRLGLADVAHHYPAQLSGGQRQRVAIARTLALEPDLLLMDEPFSSLDALTREELQNLIIELGIEGTLTTVHVSHSIEQAVFLGRRILVLSQPPLRTARIVENPKAGDIAYRGEPSFHAKCNEVRELVEELRRGQT